MTIDTFAFDAASESLIAQIIGRYPPGRKASAVMPLLDLAQRQCGGWLPSSAIEEVATRLGMPKMRVQEVASFYTMFNTKPVGKHHVQICTTTPCWLRGSDAIVEVCKAKLGINMGEVTADGTFSVMEVECLGACVNAPMVQINDDYYEDLTGEGMAKLLDRLASGETVPGHSELGRRGAEPCKKGDTL